MPSRPSFCPSRPELQRPLAYFLENARLIEISWGYSIRKVGKTQWTLSPLDAGCWEGFGCQTPPGYKFAGLRAVYQLTPPFDTPQYEAVRHLIGLSLLPVHLVPPAAYQRLPPAPFVQKPRINCDLSNSFGSTLKGRGWILRSWSSGTTTAMVVLGGTTQ